MVHHFEQDILTFLVSVRNALTLNYFLIKNSAEGSASAPDAGRNIFRTRYMVQFPETLDGLPYLSEETFPKAYPSRNPEGRRKIFDDLGTLPPRNR